MHNKLHKYAKESNVHTCVNTCMFLQASFSDKRLFAEAAVKSLKRVVERPVHFQAVLGGKALPADLAAVRPHPCVVQHMNTERVKLGQRLATDVTHKLPLGAVLRRVFRPLRIFSDSGSRHAGSLGLLMLVTGQMCPQRRCILELFIADLKD